MGAGLGPSSLHHLKQQQMRRTGHLFRISCSFTIELGARYY